MLNSLRAQRLAHKRRFAAKLLWIAPVLAVLLVVALMAGRYLQAGAYNWWYTLLLPGSFTIFVAQSVAEERRKNRHGLFGVVTRKNQLWLAQIAFYTGYLLATCLAFFVAVTFAGFMVGERINLLASALASLLLFITFAWQIPLWMFVTEKAGQFTAILISLLCNFAMGVFFAPAKLWWVPFAIPARLMCPVIGVMPNGLPVALGSPQASPAVILPGVLITLALYLLLCAITALWFEKREVA